ncbi:MAG TPA: nitrilase-related carbon-nitrogen hydrolase, partial [Anaerolineae bacterium]|nr:nitrilase-related carbon-nitrogen hydrolase [Anaerolineae bacterium]
GGGVGERVLAATLSPLMRWRSRPARLQAVLDALPYEQAAQPALPMVRVAAVQFDINLTFSAADYARHSHEMVRRAVQGGAGLVVFPEYATLPLLGLLPGARRLAAMLEQGAAQAPAEPAGADGDDSYGTMALALRLTAPAALRVYRATFSALAARFGVTLVAGSAIELGPDGRLYNVGYLYGSDGRELARQVKTHLVPSEVAMGYGVGEDILVTSTAAGRLALPVCMDHTYYETARIAALTGADLLIDPSANNEYYNPYAQARGVWNRVQEVHTFGVLCSGVGRVAGSVFQGRSGVYAPLAMTPAGDGVLAEAQTCDQEEIVFADLDYAALHAYQAQEPLELNLAQYRRYLPAAYLAV